MRTGMGRFAASQSSGDFATTERPLERLLGSFSASIGTAIPSAVVCRIYLHSIFAQKAVLRSDCAGVRRANRAKMAGCPVSRLSQFKSLKNNNIQVRHMTLIGIVRCLLRSDVNEVRYTGGIVSTDFRTRPRARLSENFTHANWPPVCDCFADVVVAERKTF